jgi:hypothetical protein
MYSSTGSLIQKLQDYYEDFDVYIMRDAIKQQYAYIALEKYGVSPHVDGSVHEVALCISNFTTKAPLAYTMRLIIKQAREAGISWLITHRHIGPLQYKARYCKL